MTNWRRYAASLALLLCACHPDERDAPLRHSASAPMREAPPRDAAPPNAPTPLVAPAPSEVRPAARRALMAVVGDSLTDPRSHGGGYLAPLQARCPTLQIDNFGRGGAMVNQMRRRFEQDVVASNKPYTHLLVFGGVNDLYSDLTALRTPAKIEADLSAMYGWAHAHHVRVIAFTVAPWGGFARYFNASRAKATLDLNTWITKQRADGKVDHMVDAYTLLSCGDPERLCDRYAKPFRDGLHFGPEGHHVLGEVLVQALGAECE